jgi:hypothetical protein
MKQLTEIQHELTPAVITTNIDAIRAQLSTELKKYDVVVTQDTLQDAKKLAADLNKVSASINTTRKAIVAEASAPITEADKQMKSLMEMCAEGRKKIADQVAQFDAVRLEQAKKVMASECESLYAEHNLDDRFRTVVTDSLAKISSLTSTGKLTAGAEKSLREAVEACAKAQDTFCARIARLESMSEMAGLKTPIDKSEVDHILELKSEQEYDYRLSQILEHQRNREERAAAKAVEVPANEAPEPAPAPQEPEPKPEPQLARPSSPGKTPVRVTCVFDTEVNPAISVASIEAEIRRVLLKAGIKTLTSVDVQKAAMENAA